MSFHRIDIRDGKIFRNEQPQGKLSTTPLEGIRAQTSVSSENGISFLHLQWKIKKPPQPAAPLGLLRIELDDFFPASLFVAGRRYECVGSTRPQEREKGFPYNTYYKFRIFPRAPYDAALHAKLPLVCWQRDDCAFGIIIPKFVRLSNKWWPVCIQVNGPGSQAIMRIVLPDQFRVQRKPYGWFGARSTTETYSLNLANEHSIEAAFGFVAADTWPECVRKSADFFEEAGEPKQPEPEALVDALEKSLHFYNRAWDGRNRTHVHLPVKNVPGFESVEYKYSHVTDDITKLVHYRRLMQAGFESLKTRERELFQKIIDGAYTRKDGGGGTTSLDGALWHTTTYFNGSKLEAFTHHGVGFVGFPGGMATNARRLYEYYRLSGDDKVLRLADAGVEWLARLQRKDGSWPAVVQKDKENADGCVASTAESARALLAAYQFSRKQEHLKAAQAAAQFINREQSFFECRQYLRDVGSAEADGITPETCIHANLDLFAIASEEAFVDDAAKWGYYALQWVRPFFFDKKEGPSFDGLSESITPRVDVWGALLVARALLRLGRASGEQRWTRHAWRQFDAIIKLQERDGGLCETWFFDFPNGFESIHIEPTFVTDALVEFILDACDGQPDLSAEILRRKQMIEKKFPPLQPIAPIPNLVTLSKTEPEFLISRTVRLSPIFSGSGKNKALRAAYRILRTKPFRRAMKLAPAAKVLLNRYRLRPPVTDLRPPDRMKLRNMRCESFGIGRQRCIYRSPFYNLTLSVLGAGNNEANLPANDIGLEIETLAGDLRPEQVRIDLKGDYAVQSVSRDAIVFSAAGASFRLRIINGEVDGIIQKDGKLAFDISLSANWSFFGKFQATMRIERTQN